MKPNQFVSITRSALAAITLIGAQTVAQAATIYEENFTTTGAPSLNGEAPTSAFSVAGGNSSATWISSTLWSDTGNKTSAGFANAYLEFNPVSGVIYTLEMGMEISNVTDRFFGVGFSETANTGVAIQNNNAAAWGLLRGNSGSAAPGGVSEISAIAGPNLTDRNDILTTTLDPNGKGVFSIVLDTTATFWSVDWFFTPDGGSQTQLGSTYTYAVNPTINYVGFGAANSTPTSAVGSVSNFSLSYVPEPTSALAGLLLAAGLLRRKRR